MRDIVRIDIRGFCRDNLLLALLDTVLHAGQQVVTAVYSIGGPRTSVSVSRILVLLVWRIGASCLSLEHIWYFIF